MYPRLTDAQSRDLPGPGSANERRCKAMTKLARRRRGIALALIRAAVTYATEKGAPSVEAYPRAGATRTGDDNAYFGTEPLFRRAGFRVVRKPQKSVPRNWVPRVTVRAKVGH